MVTVGLTFISALVGWSATAALTAYAQRRPGVAAIAWTIAALGITVGLSAAVIGVMFDFGGATFRLLHVGISLIGPVYLAWGAFEYAVRAPNARFTSRLFLSVFTIVPLVVLAVDRVSERFGDSFPPLEHYDLIPRALVNGAQVFVVVLLVTALVAVVRRGLGGRGRVDLLVVLLLLVAALLSIVVGRAGLGALGPVLMLGSLAALWGAGAMAAKPRRDPYDEVEDDYYDDEYDDVDDELDDPQEEPVRRKRRHAENHEEDLYGGAPSAPPSKVRGVITIYTLAEGQGEGFDRLASAVVAQVSAHEPDTLLFAAHTVPSAPLQRIVYAIYRDELAQEEHERQPHILEFGRLLSGYVVATNVIELSLADAAAGDGLAAMLMPR